MKEKAKLKEKVELNHVYINKFIPKFEKEVETGLRKEIAELNKSVDDAGKISFQGKNFDLAKGRFVVNRMRIKFQQNRE